MKKSKIRSKILKFRKKKFNKNLKINWDKFISFLKNNIPNTKKSGGYYPSNYEIDDLEILEVLKKQNFKISLPVVKKDNQMNFYSWSKKDPLKINKFGIPEPVSLKILYPDILLVPLVGYDDNLNRLGYGGGFYDRYIEKVVQTALRSGRVGHSGGSFNRKRRLAWRHGRGAHPRVYRLNLGLSDARCCRSVWEVGRKSRPCSGGVITRVCRRFSWLYVGHRALGVAAAGKPYSLSPGNDGGGAETDRGTCCPVPHSD